MESPHPDPEKPLPDMAGPVGLLRRRLSSQTIGPVTLLDAIAEGNSVALFFAKGTQIDAVSLSPGWSEVWSGQIVGSPLVILEADPGTGLAITVGDQTEAIAPAPAETDILAGQNAPLGQRNGESADTVIQWLHFHATHFDASAAVIVDRAPPGSDPEFSAALSKALSATPDIGPVVLVESAAPLGRVNLPPESHPYCSPAAPGRARMVLPPPDQFRAPLGELGLFEMMRRRFLNRARAVANIEVYDLLDPTDTPTVFDRAVAASDGVITLHGQEVYPWRLRNEKATTFGDHSCVQFDNDSRRRRWCIAPNVAPEGSFWRFVRIGNVEVDAKQTGGFFRCMALRHSGGSVSQIVPKSSLVEQPAMIALAKSAFGRDPVAMPDMALRAIAPGNDRRVIVTAMKNEGPFILEWIAHNYAIGFTDILVYSNDCTDETDTMLDLLQDRGWVQHRENPFRSTAYKPQHAALHAASEEPVVQKAAWIACIDVDEFINIHPGEGRLDDLFAAVPEANMISMTWRLFGNDDIDAFEDRPVTDQFTSCAAKMTRKPHQAWGFKTLFRNNGVFRKLGVHRPRGLNGPLWEHINWVGGSGTRLPKQHYRNAWRSTSLTIGYDLVTLNHYAVRSAESFLVKRDRGRVNHVDRDQGLPYWFRINNNAEVDTSIQRRAPLRDAVMQKLLSDPEIAAQHARCVGNHRRRIAELRATPRYAEFFDTLTGRRMRRLSRMHQNFGAAVFLAGPQVVPDEVLEQDVTDDLFFTVPTTQEVAH